MREFFDELTKGSIPDRFPLTIQFEVNDDGLITKYLLLEDSWHIADAVRP